MQQRVKLKAPKFPPLNNVKIWRKASECCADVGCKAACAIKRRKQSCRWNSEASEWKGRMKAKVKGKVIIWEGKKKKSDQGMNGLNLFFPFTTVQVYKTQRPAWKVFLSDAPRPDPSVKVSSFPFAACAHTKLSTVFTFTKLSASSG